jgi:hypothetical protein
MVGATHMLSLPPVWPPLSHLLSLSFESPICHPPVWPPLDLSPPIYLPSLLPLPGALVPMVGATYRQGERVGKEDQGRLRNGALGGDR